MNHKNNQFRALVIGSKNVDKVREISVMVRGLPVDVRLLAEFGEIADVEETGITFTENAILKATAFANMTGELTVADDSGICVDALGGSPGIYSARYAGPGCSYMDNVHKLLGELKGKPRAERTAKFVCSVACALPNKLVFTVEGTVDGIITEIPLGQSGFGYDPLFFFEPLGRTFAQLSPGEKRAVSHRAMAITAFRHRLIEAFSIGEITTG